jgi:hypothetical protein
MLRPVALAFLTAIALLALPASSSAQGTNIIGDGGFESGKIGLPVEGQPPVYGEWVADQPSAGDTATAEAVTSLVFEGDYAGEVDTRTAQGGRFIYQDVELGSGCFKWTFHVYRDEGVNTAELLQDWDRGMGNALFVSRLTFNDKGIAFSGWGAAARTIEEPLSSGEWHEVTVEADADAGTQTLSINGEQFAEFEAADSSTVVETIILGDVAGVADHGLYTYDGVSIQATECAGAPAQETTTAGATSAPSSPAAGDADDGNFPWWIVAVVIIVAAALFFFLWWRRRRRRNEERRS